MRQPPDLSSPVSLFDSVADARGWTTTAATVGARAYALTFTPSWEGFFSDAWRADDLHTLANKVEEIDQPGAQKLADVYHQYAFELEADDPDSFINSAAAFAAGFVDTAVNLPGQVSRAATPWGPLVLGAAIVAAIVMRK